MSVAGDVRWSVHAFSDLNTTQLHDLLQLRSKVFVVEQNCVFQDVDGYDPQALHVLGMQDGLLVAYARCFPAGVKFAEASIGRVATRMQARGTGLGHFLIDEAVRCVVHAWGPQAIRIGAQARLEKYYTGHGFANVNRPYIEDGIDHLEMVRHP